MNIYEIVALAVACLAFSGVLVLTVIHTGELVYLVYKILFRGKKTVKDAFCEWVIDWIDTYEYWSTFVF